MPVTREQIQRIAALAELAVDDAAAAELERHLTRILDHVRQLEELDTGATRVADERAVRLRADVVGADPLLRPPPAFAAAMKEGLVVVPRLGELGGGEDAP
jgi:aspartyl-tRNA(Asn)/glutamyl-tRNA(Gln) amidotransferase subunit C